MYCKGHLSPAAFVSGRKSAEHYLLKLMKSNNLAGFSCVCVVEAVSDISASKCQWWYYLPETIGNGHVEDLRVQTQTEVECPLLENCMLNNAIGNF